MASVFDDDLQQPQQPPPSASAAPARPPAAGEGGQRRAAVLVSGVPLGTTTEELRRLFGRLGVVYVTPPANGQARVVLASLADAERAAAQGPRLALRGCPLVVQVAVAASLSAVAFSGLAGVPEADIAAALAPYGLRRLVLLNKAGDARHSGRGHAELASAAAAAAAVAQLDGRSLRGRTVRLALYDTVGGVRQAAQQQRGDDGEAEAARRRRRLEALAGGAGAAECEGAREAERQRAVVFAGAPLWLGEADVVALFAEHGALRRHGLCRTAVAHTGCGYVEYEGPEAVARALQLDGARYRGCELRVARGTDVDPADPRLGALLARRPRVAPPCPAVRLDHVCAAATPQLIAKFFGCCGRVVRVARRGYRAYEVAFETGEAAERALAMNGRALGGVRVCVGPAVDVAAAVKREEAQPHEVGAALDVVGYQPQDEVDDDDGAAAGSAEAGDNDDAGGADVDEDDEDDDEDEALGDNAEQGGSSSMQVDNS
eukprot:m51a1_g4736 hypothetical protein (489) ;mRNA; f:364910-366434